MLKTLVIAGSLALALSATQAAAATTTLDFDGYADNQQLNGVNLGGVTVTGSGGSVVVFANNRSGASFRSSPNSISTPNGTGFLTFVFDSVTSFVELYAGDVGGDTDSWTLEAFDAAVGGNSLGLVASGDYSGDPYVGLRIDAPGILRAVASFTGGQAGIAYDDLSFDTVSRVPLPAPAALLAGGLVLLAGVSRRSR